VVGDPEAGKQKVRDKTKLLGAMLGYEPVHQVQINYYPPRGDSKESWDNIDFEGFLGLPMQLKVNQLYRDSILAAPMCLDLARFVALAQRRGATGPQTWLSLYFKAPYGTTVNAFHEQERCGGGIWNASELSGSASWSWLLWERGFQPAIRSGSPPGLVENRSHAIHFPLYPRPSCAIVPPLSHCHPA
jgi:hypothetical protein